MADPSSRAQPDDALPVPSAAIARSGTDPTEDSASVVERPGIQIGRYKLLEQIGEGGFGLVFVAEQHAPIRRRVALKIIKPGMDTREVIARFEQERQALALMDHSNIAKVLDAGTTASGRPYFVMELVKGVPITDYCDQAQLSPRERLELFVPVCQAIQHAHQKGIIHRDIKPSNVLVAVQEGQPVVKVIDFGVAKALNQQLAEHTIFTHAAQMIGTPLYMSPEQAEMNSLDIDTRSDIYSLGVLLYVLLTGSTPFDKQRLAKAAVDEVRRIIREEEPPKPSTRLSESGDRLPSIAAQRKIEPARLSKLVRGELDWIVMKCLEKDRTRRYETANGLGRDLQRYLADEPVEASPPSAAYLLSKLLSKHRGLISTAAAFILLLVAGIATTSAMAIRASLAEAKATAETKAKETALKNEERERKKAVAETKAKESALTEEAKQRKEVERQNVQIQRELDRALKAEVLVGVYLRNTRGESSEKLGEEHADWAWRREAVGPNDPETVRMLFRVTVLSFRADSPRIAVPLLRESLDRANEEEATGESGLAAQQLALAHELILKGLYPEAEIIARAALANYENGQPGGTKRYECKTMLGNALFNQKNFVEAEPLLLDGFQGLKDVEGPVPQYEVTEALNSIVQLYEAWGKPEVSLRWRKELAGRGLFSNVVWREMSLAADWASEFRRDGQFDHAARTSERLHVLRHAYLGAKDRQTIDAENHWGWALSQGGKYEEAELHLLKSYHDAQAAKNVPPDWLTVYCERLVELYKSWGKSEQEQHWHQEQLKRPLSRDYELAKALELYRKGESLLSTDRDVEAEMVLRQCVAIRERLVPDIWFTFNARSFLGAALSNQKKYSEAEPLLLSGYDGLMQRESTIAKGFPYVQWALERLVTHYDASGKPQEAARWRKVLRPLVDAGDIDRKLRSSQVLHRRGKLGEAVTEYEQALAASLSKLGENHLLTIQIQNDLGDCLAQQDDFAAAERHLLDSFANAHAAAAVPPSWLPTYADRLANLYLRWKKPDQREAWLRKRVELLQTSLSKEELIASKALQNLGAHLLEQGKPVDAEPVCRESLRIRKAKAPGSTYHFNAQSLVGASLMYQGKYSEAEPLLLEAYRGLDGLKLTANGVFQTVAVLEIVVTLYEKWEKHDEAAKWRKTLDALKASVTK